MALNRNIVILENYNLDWDKQYNKEEYFLKEVLKDKIIEIHHVGSTSIPELKAKPVIDILIVIKNFNEIKEIDEILKQYDYTNCGYRGVDDRYFFAKGPEEARTYYIHFTLPNSDTYYNQLYFKRYLIEHHDYLNKYCKLKQELAEKYADERPKYTQGKNDFIKEVINLAHKEYDT